MDYDLPDALIAKCYDRVHGTRIKRSFDHFLVGTSDHGLTAALGYRCAADGRLFLESYLDRAIEAEVSRAFGRQVLRADIVELGNFAATNGLAMIELWGRAANDLGSASLVAVATLTRPLRSMFARIGLPVTELTPARAEAVGDAACDWGNYYRQDPMVCAGLIAEGQQALARYFARRSASVAA